MAGKILHKLIVVVAGCGYGCGGVGAGGGGVGEQEGYANEIAKDCISALLGMEWNAVSFTELSIHSQGAYRVGWMVG